MTSAPPTRESEDFLSGGGEMGALIRAHDWAATALGPVQSWPQPLRTALRIMLTTRHPIFVFWGPDHLCFYNDSYRRSIGPERHPSALGRPGRIVWEEIWDIIGPQIDLVMRGHGATWHEDHLVPITRHGRREDVYWTYSYGPIDDESAATGVGGVLVICTETTQKVLAERRQRLLAEELKHRVKNTLATVQAIAAQSLRGAATLNDAREAFTARIAALSRAQDALSADASQGSDLAEIVSASIAHLGGPDRFRIDGPAVRLAPKPAFALTLMLHELSTNALKYGALRVDSGRIAITWTVERAAVPSQLRVRWEERGGPPVELPTHEGFGTRLIQRGLAADLGGQARIDYEPDGVVCTLQMGPAAYEQQP